MTRPRPLTVLDSLLGRKGPVCDSTPVALAFGWTRRGWRVDVVTPRGDVLVQGHGVTPADALLDAAAQARAKEDRA